MKNKKFLEAIMTLNESRGRGEIPLITFLKLLDVRLGSAEDFYYVINNYPDELLGGITIDRLTFSQVQVLRRNHYLKSFKNHILNLNEKQKAEIIFKICNVTSISEILDVEIPCQFNSSIYKNIFKIRLTNETIDALAQKLPFVFKYISIPKTYIEAISSSIESFKYLLKVRNKIKPLNKKECINVYTALQNTQTMDLKSNMNKIINIDDIVKECLNDRQVTKMLMEMNL